MEYKFGFQNSFSNQIHALYLDAGWTTYTDKLENLMAGIENSLDVITCWDGDRLVGLIRSIGDNNTILYIQDIIVLKEFKRKSIGRTLVTKLLNLHPVERQIVLMTENNLEMIQFYESLGFQQFETDGGVGFGMNRI